MVLEEKIGEGNTAEVYIWGEKHILKLFYSYIYESFIHNEFKTSQEVYQLGLHAPQVKEKISLKNRNYIQKFLNYFNFKLTKQRMSKLKCTFNRAG
ncbi:hypothetical protein QUF99_14310 [Bacillus sp. DX4.1]|uniref:hypothetical protein n=1 Tax=Bacillus sp. DX4.1 TaxID=3055867 RepID=UPI0025A1ED8A|nr:hypothetical protein [Bacillus sp. DX4.1]MDM5188446.1 hypothetical protein [Bacillus sp. DX4.1]